MNPRQKTVRLVTGDTGFVGRHALNAWQQACGLAQAAGRAVDLRDKEGLCAVLSQVQPDEVVHLAGISHVPFAIKNPHLTYEVNFLGTLNLFEALAETGFRGRLLFVGSGDAYGLVAADKLPIQECLPLRPLNPYAVSKAAAESLCHQWARTGPFEVLVARPFNHLGPGQSAQFAVSDFARQITEMEARTREPVLAVGNIDVTRDFSDVRDVLSAYDALLKHAPAGETYNVCSGVERSLRSLIEQLLELSSVRARIVPDPARWRAADQARVRASHDKLTHATGWRPMWDMEETLSNLLNYWRNEIEK